MTMVKITLLEEIHLDPSSTKLVGQEVQAADVPEQVEQAESHERHIPVPVLSVVTR